MSTPSLIERILSEHRDAAQNGASLSAATASALQSLVAGGLPTPRAENWKYANLRLLDKARFSPTSAPLHTTLDEARSLLPERLPGYGRFVFVDGRFAAELSAPLTELLTVETASARLPDGPPETGDLAFATIGAAFGIESLRVHVPAGRSVSIEVVFVTTVEQQTAAAHPQLRLQAEPASTVRLVERHIGATRHATFTNGHCMLSVAQGATVEHTRLLADGPRSVLLDTLNAVLGPDANYRLGQFTVSGLSTRSTLRIELAGRGANVDFQAASIGSAQGVADIYALIEHRAPNTGTREQFRGIAVDRSRIACNGHIVMREAATGAQSQQSLRALLAGNTAEADLRPQLEIYTDDVKASHGATTGKLDPEQLFYLLSRGIEADVAEQLMKWAFIEEVVTAVRDPGLRKQIEVWLGAHLQSLGVTEVPQ